MQNREKVTFRKKSGESKLRDSFLFVLIFILSIVTIVTMQIKSYKKDEADRTNAETVNSMQIDEDIYDDNVQAVHDINNILPDENTKKKNDSEIKKEYVFTYSKPVKGEVIKEFSDRELLYSKTMDDWRLHFGTDIACPVGTKVYACEKGVVDDVYNDGSYGHTVVIKHNETIKTLYSNLASDIMFSKGDNINKGDFIGVVIDSASSEMLDESHLHFSMKEDDEYVNPYKYINNM